MAYTSFGITAGPNGQPQPYSPEEQAHLMQIEKGKMVSSDTPQLKTNAYENSIENESIQGFVGGIEEDIFNEKTSTISDEKLAIDYETVNKTSTNKTEIKIRNIGLPPHNPDNENYYKNAFTEIKLTPCISEFDDAVLQTMSTKILRLVECSNDPVKRQQETVGNNYFSDLYHFDTTYNFSFDHNDNTFTVYAPPESVSSDISINNTYTDSVLERFSNLTSDTVREVKQLIPGVVNSLTQYIDAAQKKYGIPKNIASGVQTSLNMLTGNRMTFPKIWSGSNSSMTLSFTTRLYGWSAIKTNVNNEKELNSQIDIDDSYLTQLIGPLDALVLLGVPISADGVTYSQPYYLRVEIDGVLRFDQACVTSLSINPQPLQERSHQYIPEYIDVNMTIELLDDNFMYVRGDDFKELLNTNSIQKILSSLKKKKALLYDKELENKWSKSQKEIAVFQTTQIINQLNRMNSVNYSDVQNVEQISNENVLDPDSGESKVKIKYQDTVSQKLRDLYSTQTDIYRA